jgi:hypothetical protein
MARIVGIPPKSIRNAGENSNLTNTVQESTAQSSYHELLKETKYEHIVKKHIENKSSV